MAQFDELFFAVAVTVEEAADEWPRLVDRTIISRVIEKDAATTARIIDDVADQFVFAAHAHFGGPVGRRSEFRNLRLALGVADFNFDQQRAATLSASAQILNDFRMEAFPTCFGIMALIFVEIVNIGIEWFFFGHADSVPAMSNNRGTSSSYRRHRLAK